MTSKFTRKFDITKLPTDSPLWWRELLLRLKPSGTELGDYGLRFAVRDGYLNFYHKGQAIAKVGFDRYRHLYSEQHVKYVFEQAKQQKYSRITGYDLAIENPEVKGEFVTYQGGETLEKWINRSKGYKGEEKTFVEQVIAANDTIIDMEMGLPGSGYRIDLVALERDGDFARLVLWEAKLTTDSRCRTNGSEPEVIKQLQQYREFLSDPKKQQQVVDAFIAACQVQTAIFAAAGQTVAPIIRGVAEGSLTLVVDPEPRLLMLHSYKGCGQDSWLRHQQKLLDLGVRLQVMTLEGSRVLQSGLTA